MVNFSEKILQKHIKWHTCVFVLIRQSDRNEEAIIQIFFRAQSYKHASLVRSTGAPKLMPIGTRQLIGWERTSEKDGG